MLKPPRFAYCITTQAGWFRVFGRGLSYTRAAPLFSERHGFKQPILKVLGYRVFWLGDGYGY